MAASFPTWVTLRDQQDQQDLHKVSDLLCTAFTANDCTKATNLLGIFFLELFMAWKCVQSIVCVCFLKSLWILINFSPWKLGICMEMMKIRTSDIFWHDYSVRWWSWIGAWWRAIYIRELCTRCWSKRYQGIYIKIYTAHLPSSLMEWFSRVQTYLFTRKSIRNSFC